MQFVWKRQHVSSRCDHKRQARTHVHAERPARADAASWGAKISQGFVDLFAKPFVFKAQEGALQIQTTELTGLKKWMYQIRFPAQTLGRVMEKTENSDSNLNPDLPKSFWE